MPEKESDRVRFTMRLSQDIMDEIQAALPITHLHTRTSFIEAAIRFYLGYVKSQNQQEYLSDTLVAMMKASLDAHTSRMAKLYFKMAIELNVLGQMMALQDHYTDDELDLMRRLAMRDFNSAPSYIAFETARQQVEEIMRPEGDTCQD